MDRPVAQATNFKIVGPREGDFTVRDFKFASGETLPELKLHYTTLGAPKRDASGRITNAVNVLEFGPGQVR